MKGQHLDLKSLLQFNEKFTHASITFLISFGVIVGKVLLLLGWKHITRQVPLAPAIWNKGSSDFFGSGTPSKSAGKSLVKTNVDS